jgi:hypothetical protein
MRIHVYARNSGILPRLTAPPVGVTDKKHLVLCKVLQSRKISIRLLPSPALPCLERSGETSCVGDVFTEGEPAVDMEWLIVWSGHGEVGVLVDKAVGLLFKSVHGGVGPPVGVIPILIIVPSSRIEGVGELL